MYCTCSNKNNYEVISLCNVKKLNDKYPNFNRIPWTQISITDILILECNKPPIEAIQKIYVDTFIASSKIIETPKSNGANPEGMTLTGKKLLIDGYICAKIVYTSLTPCQSIHTATFNTPFCTYVVIEEDADAFTDIYCVKYCIEDVFLSLVDCKSIFQNITLFLFAIKTTPTCPNPRPPQDDCTIRGPIILQNTITIKSSTDQTVATIQFDATNQVFIVNSTGQIPDSSQGAQEYFVLSLRKTSNKNVVIREHITSNANAFQVSLNNQKFSFTEHYLELVYLKPSKIMISNFPSSPMMHIPTKLKENFKITINGLEDFTPPLIPILGGTPSFQNSIIINSLEGNELATLNFDTQNNIILVTSSNEISEISDCTFNYFSFKLKDSSTYEIKSSAFISTNTDSNIFAQKLNNTTFNTSDIIELECSYPNTIIITNYPTIGINRILVNALENYTITNQSLQSYTIPENISPPTITTPILSLSKIILKNESYEEVLTIELNKGKFRCACTGEIANKILGNIDYFSFTLEDVNGVIKFYEKINAIEIGDTFCNNLNNFPYKELDRIILTYEDNSKVLITEYESSTSYTPLENTESFIISNNNLSPIS